MHDKNKLVGKYMHIYTPTNTTTARQVVHLTTTNCEYFENYITKATEVIFNISMNICYTTSIIVQLCALSSQPNLITYQILHLIWIKITVLCEKKKTDMRDFKRNSF